MIESSLSKFNFRTRKQELPVLFMIDLNVAKSMVRLPEDLATINIAARNAAKRHKLFIKEYYFEADAYIKDLEHDENKFSAYKIRDLNKFIDLSTNYFFNFYDRILGSYRLSKL